MRHGQSPSSQDDSHGALVLARVGLEPLRHQLQKSGVSELIDGADRRARLHRRSDEALAAAELDHLLGGLVDVHPGDAVHHDRAGALGERLAEVFVGGGDAAHQFEDGAVEGDE